MSSMAVQVVTSLPLWYQTILYQILQCCSFIIIWGRQQYLTQAPQPYSMQQPVYSQWSARCQQSPDQSSDERSGSARASQRPRHGSWSMCSLPPSPVLLSSFYFLSHPISAGSQEGWGQVPHPHQRPLHCLGLCYLRPGPQKSSGTIWIGQAFKLYIQKSVIGDKVTAQL